MSILGSALEINATNVGSTSDPSDRTKVVDPRLCRTRLDQRRKPAFYHTVDRTSIPARDSDSRRGRDRATTACRVMRILWWENQQTAPAEIPGVTAAVVDGDAQFQRAGRRGGVSTVRREYDAPQRATRCSCDEFADFVCNLSNRVCDRSKRGGAMTFSQMSLPLVEGDELL